MNRIVILTLLTTCIGCSGNAAPKDAGPDGATALDAAPFDAAPFDAAGLDAGRLDAATSVQDGDVAVDAPPGNVITATSCALADVQAAVDSATPPDVVRVPNGTCTWGNDGERLTIDRAITVEGTSREGTVIEMAAGTGSWGDGLIRIGAGATVRALTIHTTDSGNSGTAFSAGENDFRISEVTYVVRTSHINGYFLYAGAYGLVDACDLTGGAGNNELIFARGPGDSWQTENSLGGADNLFIEDCTFGGAGYLTDCNSNSRCVVRFNTVTAGMKVDGHGKASNTPPRGVRHMEIYGNEWTATSGYWAAIEVRGGSGRIFANHSANPMAWFFLTDYAASAAWPNFGNRVQTPADYPIDDQIGVGRDPKVGGSEPVYVWLNRAGSDQWAIGLSYSVPVATMQQIIAADRDYFNEVSGFDGSSGVGIGTTAQRDALSPTRTGVGFWVTDEGDWNARAAGPDGTLYVWSGSAWVHEYEPYPYPHPRRSR